MSRTSPARALGGRAEQAAMFIAAAKVPVGFQRTLMPRTALDQGVVTGVSMMLDYGIAAVLQDGIESLALRLLRRPAEAQPDDHRWRRITLTLDAAAMGTGFAVQSLLRQRRGEPLQRAAARTTGYWLSSVGAAGLAVGAAQEALHGLDRSGRTDRDVRSLPVALPAGGMLAAALELRRSRRDVGPIQHDERWRVSVGRAAALGAGVSLALTGLAHVERASALAIRRGLTNVLPGGRRWWGPVGHLGSLAAMAGAIRASLHVVDGRIEAGAGALEPAFHAAPTSTLVSGCPDSLVPFQTLSKQGRRNVSTALLPEAIGRVMKESAIAPIRVYVGLDSAPDERSRVRLAIDELERTGAFDRDLLMVISPTGTGYVNYVAVESAEYLARGNIASVTIQYSKRPSVLSLDRTREGRVQHRMLLLAIYAALQRRRPDRRPRLVLFGESLGAWTSQDAFMGAGTQGLEDLGVERALWIGSPYESRWKQEVLSGQRPDSDRTLLGQFNDFRQVEALDPESRARLRYVLITHDNDAVAQFGLDLTVQSPAWLGEASSRPATVPPYERWVSPTTFVQTLIDMKNSANVIPGQFAARGHDYRADLARFVAEAYALPADDGQMERIEHALRRSELARKRWIDEQDGMPRS